MSVTLTKGAPALSLKKADGGLLTKVRVGLGWDERPKAKKRGFFGGGSSGGGEIDLDASAILFGADRQVRDIVFFGQKSSKDGSVLHSGDNLTGAGEGDDEQIVVDLARVSADVTAIVFVITSYSRQKFNEIENVFARIVDLSSTSEREVARFAPTTDAGDYTAMVMVKVVRDGGGWKIEAVGNSADGRTARDVLPAAQAVV